MFFRRGLRYASAALGGTAGVTAGQAAWVRLRFQLPPDASGPTSGVAIPGDAGALGQRERRNIIFLGDSLVTGVGCDAEAGEGPTLPRRVAELLSSRLGADVGWLALGETGADIGTLSERLMPSLQSEVERCGRVGQRVDAVVIVCGLNDMKACFLFCQPHLNPLAFASNLRGVVQSVVAAAGDDCAVLLPGVCVEGVPRFRPFWPLSAFIAGAASLWEERKRTVARELSAVGARVAFSEGRGLPLTDVHFSRDGMHPNDHGYACWADRMAEDLLRVIEAGGSEAGGRAAGRAGAAASAQPSRGGGA